MIDTIRKGLGTYIVSLPHPFCKLSTPLIENLDTPLVSTVKLYVHSSSMNPKLLEGSLCACSIVLKNTLVNQIATIALSLLYNLDTNTKSTVLKIMA